MVDIQDYHLPVMKVEGNETNSDTLIHVAVASVPKKKFLVAAAKALGCQIVKLNDIQDATHVIIDSSKPFTPGYAAGAIAEKIGN